MAVAAEFQSVSGEQDGDLGQSCPAIPYVGHPTRMVLSIER